jgi:2-oxoisovalerate ferredoxin oxidoreductase beta subunit
MTGGQMAPTTLIGQKTTTTPFGRKIETEGYPLRVSEVLSSLDAPVYIERVALIDNKTNMKTRGAVRKAIKNQIEGRGFSMVEVLSPCPTGWNMSPPDALRWISEYMLPWFPLKVFKDETATRQPVSKPRTEVGIGLVPEILGLVDDKVPIETVPLQSTTARPQNRYEKPRIKIAGFGGQGLLFLGRVMAEAGMLHGYNVSWLPSYGPEMRGGTANCQVTISNEPISSPLVSRPTVLVAMNRPSLERFENEMVSDGLLIYDNSMIEIEPSRHDIEAAALPATRIADQLGSAKAANMVVLGFYIERTKVLEKNVVLRALRQLTKKESLVELNLKAIEAGIEFAICHQ